MRPAIRTQVDGKGDYYSQLAAEMLPVEEDLARQEFAQEADVNVYMARYGGLPTGQLTYGEVDYDLDLQTGLNATREAQAAWANLPEQLRLKYGEWANLLHAMQTGEYQKSMAVEQAERAVEQPEKAQEG